MKGKVNGKRRPLRVIINSVLITGDTVVNLVYRLLRRVNWPTKSCCSVGFDLLSVDGMSIIVFQCADSDKFIF